MGFLSNLFKQKHKPKAGPMDRIEMLRKGYKENFDGEFFPPDTVWTAPRSKVYHAMDYCTGGDHVYDGVPLPESEAVRRGLRRCKRCEWPKCDPPPPGEKPVNIAVPIRTNPKN